MVTKIFSRHREHIGLCVTDSTKISKIMNLINDLDVLEAFRIFGLASISELEGPLTRADICPERLEFVKSRLRRADAIRDQLFTMYSDNNNDIMNVFEFYDE